MLANGRLPIGNVLCPQVGRPQVGRNTIAPDPELAAVCVRHDLAVEPMLCEFCALLWLVSLLATKRLLRKPSDERSHPSTISHPERRIRLEPIR